MKRGLRARLLLAFVLASVPPVVVLALLVGGRVSQAYEESAAARLRSALDTTRERTERMHARAEAQVTLVATLDLPAAAAGADERGLAEALGARRGLLALEILDERGLVLSSRHWPAGFGLPDRDGGFPGTDAFRVETTAEGYGAAERLAIVATRTAIVRGARVTVRGGAFLDAEAALELTRASEVEVGFYDSVRQRWTAAPGSPLSAWRPGAELGRPGLSEEAMVGGIPYRVRTALLCPSLFVVAAVPRSDLDRVLAAVRRDTLVATALAVASALAAGLFLSARLARPIRDLAAGARRVAAGDLDGRVVVATSDEIADLARAFNAMTADLRDSRERLVQAERVAAWREMARRLAHELKNPIFPIQVSLDTLGRALERDPQGFAALFRLSSATILQELASLRRIVEEFSEFARMPQPRLAATDLGSLLEQVLTLQRGRAGDVVIEKHFEASLGAVQADRDLLSRAFGNLVANALEAMPGGGALRVRTRAQDGWAVVEIEDTGPGLDEEQRRRLFTPYFTTKQGGTGLGLAIVQGIVSDHGGRIDVRSELGRGTTFVLALPASVSPENA